MKKLTGVQVNFKDFLEAAKIQLGFLARDYGFIENEPRFGGYECHLSFERPDLSLSVIYEIKSSPFAQWSVFLNGKWKTTQFWKLVEQSKIKLEPQDARVIRKGDKENPENYLVVLARVLRETVLKGQKLMA